VPEAVFVGRSSVIKITVCFFIMETTLANETNTETSLLPDRVAPAERTVFAVLFAISFSHMLNDTIQALIPSLYPLLKQTLGLSFGQLGLVTLTFQCTASLLQQLVGL
jgi:MFS transporter, FSR family, fosmidomycin resistance protein